MKGSYRAGVLREIPADNEDEFRNRILVFYHQD